RELDALGVLLLGLGQAGLRDPNLAAAQRLDLLRDDVAGVDLVAELGEAGGGHETDPADADYSDGFLLGHEGAEATEGSGGRPVRASGTSGRWRSSAARRGTEAACSRSSRR